ncbi:MAG TPA: VWA domain-containing protein, partial [Micromonosporaceae bacterium]|nr:VWA domain-containing protein [Micromonosporaceae bacterium]
DSVSRTLTTWTALTQPTNLLLVLDVSGSMKELVPGSGQTRLALAKKAARDAIGLFPEDAHVGLWAFSTRQNGTRDYRTVVPVGALGDPVGGQQTRKQALLAGVDSLQPAGDTGLYDTIAAAQRALLDSYRKNAANLVVLLTDGKNDDTTGGLAIAALRDQLAKNSKDPARRVPVVLIGFGNDVDFATLQEISRITGATARSSREVFDINQVLISAIFGGSG